MRVARRAGIRLAISAASASTSIPNSSSDNLLTEFRQFADTLRVPAR